MIVIAGLVVSSATMRPAAALESESLNLWNPVVGIAAAPGNGFWAVTDSGFVETYDGATNYGNLAHVALTRPIVGIAATASGHGYWLVASDGGIFSFGDAYFYGSTGSIRLNQPVVGMASTPTGRGYWLVARDGGIFSYGDAHFYGSTGSIHLNRPIVGMTASPSGRGYWFVASDGGVFGFGDAHFYGSTGSTRLKAPIVGMSSSKLGHGYWLAGRDGAVFNFGDARFYGAAVGDPAPTVGIARTLDGTGYWLVHEGGFPFASARGFGSVAPLAFKNVYEAQPGSCTFTSDGTLHASYTVTYTNGKKELRTITFPADAWVHLQVAGYTLNWSGGPGYCSPDAIQIKHVLVPGKTSQYAFSGGCGTWAHGWTLYYNVSYTDGTHTGGQVPFDTHSLIGPPFGTGPGGGTMYVDFGHDLTVSHTWGDFFCG